MFLFCMSRELKETKQKRDDGQFTLIFKHFLKFKRVLCLVFISKDSFQNSFAHLVNSLQKCLGHIWRRRQLVFLQLNVRFSFSLLIKMHTSCSHILVISPSKVSVLVYASILLWPIRGRSLSCLILGDLLVLFYFLKITKNSVLVNKLFSHLLLSQVKTSVYPCSFQHTSYSLLYCNS